MSVTQLCNIEISKEIPQEEIDNLETELKLRSIEVQRDKKRFLGVDDVLIICAILGGISSAVSLTEKGVKGGKALSDAIIEWRSGLKAKGIEPKGELKHRDREDLDLSSATDEDVEEWSSRE